MASFRGKLWFAKMAIKIKKALTSGKDANDGRFHGAPYDQPYGRDGYQMDERRAAQNEQATQPYPQA